MDPVTLTTGRLLLRTVGPQDAEAVYAACQNPAIQRWTTIPSPYLREHARLLTERLAPDGWANGSVFTFGAFLPRGELAAVLSVTMHPPGAGEIGFWGVREHRGHGYVTEGVRAVCHWAFTRLAIDRVEWRAEAGNTASRAVARRAGFTLEGTLRSAIDNKGVRRDCWVGSLLPCDLGLPSTVPYVPVRSR
ncbi:hypothetical protein SUDANB58_02173 [Streptomyces sp. enrichment culture]|uniref:GNAT family N-acetyltransferase n=1 Tax=Streptomyces sp. enrichment culture TaxID=1795815 RepID=UPI003F546651